MTPDVDGLGSILPRVREHDVLDFEPLYLGGLSSTIVPSQLVSLIAGDPLVPRLWQALAVDGLCVFVPTMGRFEELVAARAVEIRLLVLSVNVLLDVLDAVEVIL